ncbi:MAG: hypothetical protein JKX76_04305 [Colwellia sp.]|nr:hypothetical protein [Colwellia sp.]
MATPTDTINTSNLDSGDDDPSLARVDLLELANVVKAIILDIGAGNTVWTNANDGAGSGLDADTVDGNQASTLLDDTTFNGQLAAYYRNANNMNAGELPAGRLNSNTDYDMQFKAGSETDLAIKIAENGTGFYGDVGGLFGGALHLYVAGQDSAWFSPGFCSLPGGTMVMELDFQVLSLINTNATFSGSVLTLLSNRSATSAYNFFDCQANGSRKARLDGTGQLHLDNGTIATPGDYAEAYEWLDGNPEAEDRVGLSVVLEGNYIREATVGESPIGVVSARPVIIGDAAPFNWHGKYLLDEFGRHVLDAAGNQQFSPDYDPELSYVPRLERKEYDPVGTHGKLWVKPGQVINIMWHLLETKENGLKRYAIL